MLTSRGARGLHSSRARCAVGVNLGFSARASPRERRRGRGLRGLAIENRRKRHGGAVAVIGADLATQAALACRLIQEAAVDRQIIAGHARDVKTPLEDL